MMVSVNLTSALLLFFIKNYATLFTCSGIEKSSLKAFLSPGGSDSEIKYNVSFIENLIQIISVGCQQGILRFIRHFFTESFYF